VVALNVVQSKFPFRKYRAGQREAIDRAREAFQSGKRFVVIEAPTGSGKSAIAVTLAREAKSAYLLTAQKILQEQYVREFPDLAMMKGRANYSCEVAPTHAAAAPCIAGHRFAECESCPYFSAKGIAITSHGAVLNYAYFLAELNHEGGFSERELLVLDEAHNAEAALMNYVEITLSDQMLIRVGLTERIPTGFDDETYYDFAANVVPYLVQRSCEIETQLRKAPLASGSAITLMQTKQWLDQQIRRLELLEKSREEMNDEWVVERWRDGDGLGIKFKPVRVSGLAEGLLFGFSEKILMLSATILDSDTFLRSLGIEPEQAEVVRIESNFPPKNRPLFQRPVGKLTRMHLDSTLPLLVNEIANLFNTHPNDKGVIHAHSYRIAQHIARNLPRSLSWRLLTHSGPEGRELALDEHLNSRDPTVLLTPSMTEGIDLVDHLARWQVICKIPYPYLGDPQVARRKELDPGWYQWRTCLTMVQAYGRSVRSPDDFAVTYILDADFSAFAARQGKRLPEWFLAALQSE
jgi:ATP-dependent DNA helicase DinG